MRLRLGAGVLHPLVLPVRTGRLALDGRCSTLAFHLPLRVLRSDEWCLDGEIRLLYAVVPRRWYLRGHWRRAPE